MAKNLSTPKSATAGNSGPRRHRATVRTTSRAASPNPSRAESRPNIKTTFGLPRK